MSKAEDLMEKSIEEAEEDLRNLKEEVSNWRKMTASPIKVPFPKEQLTTVIFQRQELLIGMVSKLLEGHEKRRRKK